MTQSQAIYRKNLLAKIHTHAEHKRIAAAGAWSDWLGYRFGVGSAAGLSISEIEHVLAVFGGRISDELNLTPDILGRNLVANARAKKARQKAEFSSARGSQKDARKLNSAEFTAKITPRQFNKILAMSAGMGWERLSKFIIRQTKNHRLRPRDARAA